MSQGRGAVNPTPLAAAEDSLGALAHALFARSLIASHAVSRGGGVARHHPLLTMPRVSSCTPRKRASFALC